MKLLRNRPRHAKIADMKLWSAIFAVLACLGATVAHAQMSDVTCDDSATLHRQLSGTLGAERRGWGVREPGAVLEIWIVGHTGDWMMVQRYANGTSCIVALGEDWEQSRPLADPLREPSKG